MEMKDNQADKIKRMKARIKELERAVGQKQMNIEYLEKMMDLAKERYGIDIKKIKHPILAVPRLRRTNKL